jgi:predicted ribonuclease toxin of YeeF-YezG toxin-antitoxin module
MRGEKMLEIKKAGIAFDEKELMKLERIITDQDEAEALEFLKRAVYNKLARGQQGRLKSHLDTGRDPVEGFKNR